jgi:hypothetical protein
VFMTVTENLLMCDKGVHFTPIVNDRLVPLSEVGSSLALFRGRLVIVL